MFAPIEKVDARTIAARLSTAGHAEEGSPSGFKVPVLKFDNPYCLVLSYPGTSEESVPYLDCPGGGALCCVVLVSSLPKYLRRL
jgi:hypothetical protein